MTSESAFVPSGFAGLEPRLPEELKQRLLATLVEYKQQESRRMDNTKPLIAAVDAKFGHVLGQTMRQIDDYRFLLERIATRSDPDRRAFLEFVGVPWQGEGMRAYRPGGSIRFQPLRYTLRETADRTASGTPVSVMEQFLRARFPDRPQIQALVEQEGTRLRELLTDVLNVETEAAPHMETLYCADHTPTAELTGAQVYASMPDRPQSPSTQSAAEGKSARGDSKSPIGAQMLPFDLTSLIADLALGAGVDRAVECVFNSDEKDLNWLPKDRSSYESEYGRDLSAFGASGADAGAADDDDDDDTFGAGAGAGTGAGAGSGSGAGAGAGSSSGGAGASRKRFAAPTDFEWEEDQPPRKRARLEADDDDSTMSSAGAGADAGAAATPTPSFAIAPPVDWEELLHDELNDPSAVVAGL